MLLITISLAALQETCARSSGATGDKKLVDDEIRDEADPEEP